MGSGTFVGQQEVEGDEIERRRLLEQLCLEFLSRADAVSFLSSRQEQ